MSGGLVDELHEIPLDRENQDLKEIIEIAFQITAQLEVENITKNVAWSFASKFQPASVTFLLPGDAEEDQPRVVSYSGVKLEETPPQVPPIAAMLAFLEKDEYSQVSFQYFQENFPDKAFAAAIEPIAGGMLVPLRTDKGVIGALAIGAAPVPSNLAEVQYITRIARFAAISIENANLFRQATTDRMTGLYSHHFFEKNLDEEMERARRYKSTFSLVMFDIDHFKKFNDTYGHVQGDLIIKEIARILTQSVRQVDFPARYGGEEFAVILPSVEAKGALVVAERLRKRVEKHEFRGEGGPLHVTISVGVAEFDQEGTYAASEIVREADKALYQSKEHGRNRVSCAAVAAG
jgi:diguanylate cyclase (GGDEF)-like protein